MQAIPCKLHKVYTKDCIACSIVSVLVSLTEQEKLELATKVIEELDQRITEDHPGDFTRGPELDSKLNN